MQRKSSPQYLQHCKKNTEHSRESFMKHAINPGTGRLAVLDADMVLVTRHPSPVTQNPERRA